MAYVHRSCRDRDSQIREMGRIWGRRRRTRLVSIRFHLHEEVLPSEGVREFDYRREGNPNFPGLPVSIGILAERARVRHPTAWSLR